MTNMKLRKRKRNYLEGHSILFLELLRPWRWRKQAEKKYLDTRQKRYTHFVCSSEVQSAGFSLIVFTRPSISILGMFTGFGRTCCPNQVRSPWKWRCLVRPKHRNKPSIAQGIKLQIMGIIWTIVLLYLRNNKHRVINNVLPIINSC